MGGPAERVPFVGLTGGLGAGKSTALQAAAELGAATISTDKVVHDLLSTASVRDLLVERLGPEVAPGGPVDRGIVATKVFDRPEDRVQPHLALRPTRGDLGELLDVRAGDEGPAAADQDDPPDRIVLPGGLHKLPNPFRDPRAQGIHRRVVDRDDRDVAILAHAHQLAHRPILIDGGLVAGPIPWPTTAGTISVPRRTCPGGGIY